MLSIKETSIKLIRLLPDNCSLEDIQYELYAKAKIEAGLQDIALGNTITEEQMDNEINTWLR